MICTHVAHKRHIMQKMRFLCLLCPHHNMPDMRTYLGVRAILKFDIKAFHASSRSKFRQKHATVAPCKFCFLNVFFCLYCKGRFIFLIPTLQSQNFWEANFSAKIGKKSSIKGSPTEISDELINFT